MNPRHHRIYAAGIALLVCLPFLTGCAAGSAPQQEPAVTEAPAAETAAPETSVPESSAESPAQTAPAQIESTDPFRYEAGTPEVSGLREDLKNVNFYRDGVKIFGQLYLPQGEGPFPTVVLCSGQTAEHTYYADEAETFAANGYAALIFDFIGSGRVASGGKMTDRSVLTEAADINVILDSLSALPKVDTGRVFLWGHSLGGLAATYAGCRRPDDIQGMMLVEPSYRYPDEMREAVAQEVNGDLSQVPDTVQLEAMRTIVGKLFVTDMYSLDIYDYMPDCDKDVLIFLGTSDDCLGTRYHDYYERAQQTFPSAEIAEIEGADHLFQGAAGEQMAAQCLTFLQSHT
ncbi:MAG: alpha/beta fold hydrolase [Oscillospiraceae bacterium]|nr:alpha/beta fold hydrolase [Oscillospiraceae bacterium]